MVGVTVGSTLLKSDVARLKPKRLPSSLTSRPVPQEASGPEAGPEAGPALARRARQDGADSGWGSARFLRLLAEPALRLLGLQLRAGGATLGQLASLSGAGSVAPLYETLTGSAPDPADPWLAPGEDAADPAA